MRENSPPTCSVLIVVKDEPSISSTLTILQKQIQEIGGECIVVDASGIALQNIKLGNPWVRWVQFDQPLGSKSTISTQRNIAVMEANSNILLFCDAGGIPSSNWVQELYAPLFSKEFSLVSGPLEFFHRDKEIEKRNFHIRGGEVKYPSCGNLGFTREIFEKSQGFNEKILVAEDDDFFRQLQGLGITSASIPGAVMRIDVGNRMRQIRRAWRYGRGIVKLLAIHKDLVVKRFRQNPDIWLYPLLAPAYVMAVAGAIFLSPFFFLCPLAISSLIILRNRKTTQPIFDHFGHFIYAFGSLWELLQVKFPKSKQFSIVQYPSDESLYIKLLIDSLNQNYAVSRKIFLPTKSATLNLLLTPLLTPVLKILGTKVINIHWIVGKWQLKWSANSFGRQLLWYWFKFWLTSIKLFRIKIVYTVHDMKFHSKIFNDDFKTQQFLFKKADALVFLNDLSKKKVLEFLPKKVFALIPEGPLKINKTFSDVEMRKRLGVLESKILLVLIGRLEEYKGVDLLFQASQVMPENFAIRIAGVCNGNYERELESLSFKARESGADIELVTEVLSDEEFAGYLGCADYFIYPCREINNSGSLNAALTANLPVIVPDRPELAWINPECKVELKHSETSLFDFQECFSKIQNMSESQYQALKIASKEWSASRSWSMVSKQYGALYREVLHL